MLGTLRQFEHTSPATLSESACSFLKYFSERALVPALKILKGWVAASREIWRRRASPLQTLKGGFCLRIYFGDACAYHAFRKLEGRSPITFLTNHNELLFITYRSVWWGSDIINFGIKHPPHVSVSLAYSVFGQLKFFGFLPSLLLFYFQSTPLVVFGRTIFYRIVFCKAVSELPWVQTISGSSDTSAFSIICSWQQTILKTYDSL